MCLTVSITFCGVQWLVEPASSPAPHLDGHHLWSVKRGIASAAAAVHEPWSIPPANTPAAPRPAVFRKLRRSPCGGPILRFMICSLHVICLHHALFVCL